jgi:hypothetical protein
MKKISYAALAAVVVSSLVGFAPAQATQQDTIAIIDAHFDPSIAGVHVCVADVGCDLVISDRNSHGSKMADTVSKNNPGAKLVLIRAGSFNKGKFQVPNAREISNAFASVPDDASVVAIAISNTNGNACNPGTASNNGTKNPVVREEVARTATLISNIVVRGGAVVAAAGNGHSRNATSIGYPACLPNVTAVAKANSLGVVQTQGLLHPELDVAVYPKTGLLGFLNTTSGLSAALASRWSSVGSSVVPNSKQFLLLDVVR